MPGEVTYKDILDLVDRRLNERLQGEDGVEGGIEGRLSLLEERHKKLRDLIVSELIGLVNLTEAQKKSHAQSDLFLKVIGCCLALVALGMLVVEIIKVL